MGDEDRAGKVIANAGIGLGIGAAFAIVVVCAAVAVGWQILRWGGLVG